MSTKENWRLAFYRSLQLYCIEPWVLPWLMPKDRISEGRRSLNSLEKIELSRGEPLGWFHAASVGELEAIWSLVDQWLSKGRNAVVTVFSKSAKHQVQKLRDEMTTNSGRILYSGYCPWEGQWGHFLSLIQPDVFVTAKYEAWPELWASLSQNEIPLVIVGARSRRSIQFARRACLWLGEAVPNLYFTTVLPSDSSELKAKFPAASVAELGDPRWDRVGTRARRGNQRARELIRTFTNFPKPWGIIGSAWKEDLIAAGAGLDKNVGTIWVVPHDLSPNNIEEILQILRERGLVPILTRNLSNSNLLKAESHACVVVDEMGVLLELYSEADWAFVGGGFGAGIHSTIEPAHYGIPVSCGPKNAESFPETELLVSAGQLTIARSPDQVAEWLKSIGQVTSVSKSRWSQQASARMGATSRVLNLVEDACGVSR